MERYHIYKLGLAILFYAVYFARQTVVNGLKIDDVTSTTNTTDYRERRDSGDESFFFQGADGTPGVDFPTLSYVPRTKFSCRDVEAGYYADIETDCQVFHICDEGRKLSFLCPNGTTFHQSELICDWWFKVNCSNSASLYEESAETLQRENAKRKDARRLSYHGTKQGVFSSKEDYGHDTIGGTPAHFVTPSYRASVKGIDNRISSTTETSRGRNYNTRGDRTSESFGNNVRNRDYDKNKQFSTIRYQNSFDNAYGKSKERDQIAFSTSAQQKASTTAPFSFRKNTYSTPTYNNFESHSYGDRRNNQQGSFDGNYQQRTKERDQNSFGGNFQNKVNNFGSKSNIEVQVTSGTSNYGNSQGFVGQTSSFDRTGGQTYQNFDTNLQNIAGGKNENIFSSSSQRTFEQDNGAYRQDNTKFNKQQSSFGQTPSDLNAHHIVSEYGDSASTFGARLQGGISTPTPSRFGVETHRKIETNGQSTLVTKTAQNADRKPSQILFDSNLENTNIYDKNIYSRFSSSTQQTQRNSVTEVPSNRNFQKISGREHNVFDGGFSDFSTSTQQTTQKKATKLPLVRNSQRTQKYDGQFAFSSNTQQPVDSGTGTIHSGRINAEQNGFGGTLQPKPVEVTLAADFEQKPSGNHNLHLHGQTDINQFSTLGNRFGKPNSYVNNAADKIKFSFSSQGKLDEFGINGNKFANGQQESSTRESFGELGHNKFDSNFPEKVVKIVPTTTSFGLKSRSSTSGSLSFTARGQQIDDDGKIPVLVVSAETQEPQETASFVKSGRNNLLGNNKQTTSNPYPNHKETYTDIKDPRHYYQQPQSKLPEKPFYGSSTSPQVLSTIPVSAQDSSSKSTTEISVDKDRSDFSFASYADSLTTMQPNLQDLSGNSQTGDIANTFAPLEDNKQPSTDKAPVTTSRFSFDIPLSTKSSLGINNDGETTIQPTITPSHIVPNKIDVTTYDSGYTNGVDINFNSVSSTLSPDIADDIQSKSTIYPGFTKTNVYDAKHLTPGTGKSRFGFSTTEKSYENSPIIKLNIIPTTLSPGYESNTRSGKAFNADSPKVQVIPLDGSNTKLFTNGPYEVTGNGGRTFSVSFGSTEHGSTGKPIIKAFTTGSQSLPPGFIKIKTNGISSNKNGNSFRVITGVNITPSVSFGKFKSSNADISVSSRSSTAVPFGYKYNGVTSIPTTADVVNINNNNGYNLVTTDRTTDEVKINNNSGYNLVTTDRTAQEVTSTGEIVTTDVSTHATPTERGTFTFNINDEIYTTPTPISTESINIRINKESYSTPASVYSSTHDNAETVTTASLAENDGTENPLYSSTSSILQPKPFSISSETAFAPNKVDISEISSSQQNDSQSVPPYTISSASPFIVTSKTNAGVEFKTPVPTLPTPYTTESASSYTYKPSDENINNMINTLMEVVRQRFGNNDIGFGTPRPGLVVPPSVGPQTLHTLAVYFANALENLTSVSPHEEVENTDEESGTNSPIIHIDNEELIKSLLTQMTRDNYDNLFKENDVLFNTTELPFPVRSGGDDENDLIREDTKHPTEGSGVRQLARVFTEALSAYLEDPDTFKKVLHDVRPTEPPQTGTDTTEAEEDEVLNYSDSDLKSDHPHLPARPTGIPVSPTWGYILAFNKTSPITDNNLASQNPLSSDNENLLSADSQSFVSQLNKIAQSYKTTLALNDGKETTEATELTNEEKAKNLPENHWTSSQDVTKLWQTTLSINPALLNENFDSSQTGFTSSDVETRFSTAGLDDNASDRDETTRVSEIQYELRALPKIELNSTQVHGILIDFMNTSETEGPGKLQRILHKLNISQDEFLDKMTEIEGNPLTRRLILLLISECNTDRNKDLESRSGSSDSVLGIAQSKLESDSSEKSSVTARRQADDDLVTTESNSFKHSVHPSLTDDDEDTRALELLNSLYVIASKFGK